MTTLIRALAVALAVALAGGTVQAQKWTEIRVATEGAYEPFNWVDKDGKLKGFDVDIANALCDQLKVKCTIVAQDWDGIIPGLLAKKYDAIVASMSITEERKQKVDFTNKYYQTPARFVAKKGSGLKITKEGLKGKSVGVQRATIHANYLQDNYKDIATVKQYDTQENVNIDLANGRLDAVLADSTVLLFGFLKKPEGKNFEFVGPELTDRKWFGEGAGIAIRKEDKDLKEMLNRAIADIRKNGTYKKLNDKYFPFDVYGK
jgi:arginine/ornithine transport system substrate-binding protein